MLYRLLPEQNTKKVNNPRQKDNDANSKQRHDSISASSEISTAGAFLALLTFVVKPVDAVDAGALVIASQHEEVLWVFDLVSEEKADCLKRLLAAVDVVTKEQVVALRWKAAILEQTQEVIILPVYVTWQRKQLRIIKIRQICR